MTQRALPAWEEYFGPEWTLVEHAVHFPNSVRDATPPADGTAERASHAVARVSGGMWIASCPQDGCRGCEFVRFQDGHFFCCECRNAGVGHRLILVDLPDDKTRRAVEDVLALRPVPATRNWTPDETIADLKVENLTHGIGV